MFTRRELLEMVAATPLGGLLKLKPKKKAVTPPAEGDLLSEVVWLEVCLAWPTQEYRFLGVHRYNAKAQYAVWDYFDDGSLLLMRFDGGELVSSQRGVLSVKEGMHFASTDFQDCQPPNYAIRNG